MTFDRYQEVKSWNVALFHVNTPWPSPWNSVAEPQLFRSHDAGIVKVNDILGLGICPLNQ
jgi:hypothetical protein